jgi:hypothetical protein
MFDSGGSRWKDWPSVFAKREGTMEQGTAGRSMPIGAILAIVGGALLAIGSFLSWATVSGAGTEVSASGMDGSDGVVTLVAGILALVCGLLAMRAGRRILAIVTILAGLAGAGLGIYDAVTAKDSVLDAAAEQVATQVGATVEEVRALLDDAIDAGQLSISISVGLYIVIGGGLLALVGGFLMLGTKGAGKAAPAEPAGFAVAATPPASSAGSGSGAAAPPPAAEDIAPPPAAGDTAPPVSGPGEAAPPSTPPAPPPPPAAPPSP